MIGLIDRIQDATLRAFVLRIYNNLLAFVVTAIPIVGMIILDYISKHEIQAFSELLVWDLWDKVLLIILSQLLSAVVAGGFKARRV